MKRAIYFDLDGTLANLYGVENWLDMIIDSDSTPYRIAKPMVNLSVLARLLNKLQKKGYILGVISWLAMGSTKEYDVEVTNAKMEWLNTHLKSVEFNEVKIVPYGTPKQEIANYPKGILFDDEENNRTNWKGVAYSQENIIEVLKELR